QNEAERHFASVSRLHETEGLSAEPIRQAWRQMRAQASPSPIRPPPAVPLVPHTRPDPAEIPMEARQRASVAILPLQDLDGRAGMAAALTHDIITRLAKLRSLFVIARGSVFALAEEGLN